ncbi:hypothetical protein [Novosphingobium sp. FSW06-99]|uniref:hypothetical protein n=1 Tax=Novosphingobium sp. FSW06-99 TaxID=1739113 RepID=UPI00076BDE21|nr:hypothetical protein [Novosphingobium sp. FSW06-99]KUR76474.1 hypothetical protein AQZ49_12495 [Novosphingobium sp. FSW06-99]
MTPITFAGTALPVRPVTLALFTLIASSGVVAHAADPGKAACMPDAKRLCAAEMQSLSRTKVRACLIAHIDQTGPTCHDFMIKARAAALAEHKPDSTTR